MFCSNCFAKIESEKYFTLCRSCDALSSSPPFVLYNDTIYGITIKVPPLIKGKTVNDRMEEKRKNNKRRIKNRR